MIKTNRAIVYRLYPNKKQAELFQKTFGCTRFVYNGKETIVGFNFDIDLSEWEHTVIAEKDRFFIGIKMSDNKYHSFHGINRNGNVGTLLYVHGILR